MVALAHPTSETILARDEGSDASIEAIVTVVDSAGSIAFQVIHDGARHIPQGLNRVISPVLGLFGTHDAEAADIDAAVAANRNCSIELTALAKLTVWSCVEAIVGGEVRNE